MSNNDWMGKALCARPEFRNLGWVTESKPGGSGSGRQRKESRKRKQLAAICNACPVIVECRQYAERIHPNLGVWGGKNYNYRFSVEA